VEEGDFPMKVSQTIIATGPEGEDLAFVEPVIQVWSLDTDELGALTSVAQMLAHARERKYTKTLAIHIEL
jgi:hypothetical protein